MLRITNFDMREKLVFLVVGGLSAGCYVILASALHSLALPPVVASAIAYVLCVPLGYLGHRFFTFRSRRPHRWAAIAYPALQGLALLMATAITFISASVLKHPPIVAFLLAAMITASASYLAQKHFVF